jgi:hypothetical protein
MTVQALIPAVAVGAAAIALWLHVRLAGRAPQAQRPIALHLALSLCLLNLAPMFLAAVVHDSSGLSKMAGLLGIVLPLLTYVFLSSIWVIKQLQSSLRLR